MMKIRRQIWSLIYFSEISWWFFINRLNHSLVFEPSQLIPLKSRCLFAAKIILLTLLNHKNTDIPIFLLINIDIREHV